MANSLLDFVMSVVRDSDAAAAYAADPAQAIADANLTDVTSADVNNLIPVVTESLPSSWSAAAPNAGSTELPGGVDGVGDFAHNVWASGAATEAFDAFGDQVPMPDGGTVADQFTIADQVTVPSGGPVIDDGVSSFVGPEPVSFDQALVTDAPAFEDTPTFDTLGDVLDDAHHAVDDHLDHPEDPGFDIFT